MITERLRQISFLLILSLSGWRQTKQNKRLLDYYKTKRCYSIPHIWQFPSVMAILGLLSISPDHAHAEMTCLSSAILSLISYDTPVVRTMNDAGQLIQIRTTVLHEQYRLNVSNSPHTDNSKVGIAGIPQCNSRTIERDINRHQG